MDIKGNKLVLQPRRHRKDRGILRAIGNGLEIRANDTIGTSEQEQKFASRVQGDLKKLDNPEQSLWMLGRRAVSQICAPVLPRMVQDLLGGKGHPFEMTVDEAPFASIAIRDNNVDEIVRNNGELHNFDSLVANNARPEIDKFVDQHASA